MLLIVSKGFVHVEDVALLHVACWAFAVLELGFGAVLGLFDVTLCVVGVVLDVCCIDRNLVDLLVGCDWFTSVVFVGVPACVDMGVAGGIVVDVCPPVVGVDALRISFCLFDFLGAVDCITVLGSILDAAGFTRLELGAITVAGSIVLGIGG